LFDECAGEIIVRLRLCAAIHEAGDAILSMFEKTAWHKGFLVVLCRVRDADFAE
jgi:hypothetical protein